MKGPTRLILSAGFALGIMACIGSAKGDFNISPDGRHLVFASTEGDLYLFDLTTHRVDRLTSNEEVEGSAAFSPDGGSLVYSASEKGRQGARLFVRSSAGTAIRRRAGTAS